MKILAHHGPNQPYKLREISKHILPNPSYARLWLTSKVEAKDSPDLDNLH